MWQIIYNNFKKLLDELELLTPLRQNSAVLDLNLTPTSIFNGSYTVNFGGINNYDMATPKVVDFGVDVLLQLSYALNVNNIIESHNQMMQDIEAIITERIDAETFVDELLEVRMKSCPIPRVDTTGAFYIWEITFTVIGRIIM